MAASACKPPPTDADLAAREVIMPSGPSEPIDSPATQGAAWSDSPLEVGRIIYGIPGEPPLLALECSSAGSSPGIVITRYAPADEGSGAMAAFIGNGHVARIPIDATELAQGTFWQTELPADSAELEVLTGTREVALTIPGGGRLAINPSQRLGEFIETCRAPPSE